MDDRERTMVALLSMHRSGSSLTAHVLQRLGMSLGPFELIGAEPTNPYGHFEAEPFHRLNRRLQNLAYGFADDLPETPDLMTQFCETRGYWHRDTHIPDELFAEGHSLARTLIDSGKVSGFKDPRTILTWPFWARVFAEFPDVRTIPLGLLRSPHEIAMSLVSRRSGWRGYWSSLDVIAIHFEKEKQILDAVDDRLPYLCFGSPAYLKTLEFVVRKLGLTWHAAEVLELYDCSAVHQRPAAVAHRAQELFESMCGADISNCTELDNRMRQERDARFLENLRLEQWKVCERKELEARNEARRLHAHASALERVLSETQSRLAQAEHLLHQTQTQVIECESKLIQSQENEIQSQNREIQSQNREIQSHHREIEAWHRIEELRNRLERFESHPLLGPALRSRRRLRRLLQSGAAGPSPGENGLEEYTPPLG